MRGRWQPADRKNVPRVGVEPTPVWILNPSTLPLVYRGDVTRVVTWQAIIYPVSTVRVACAREVPDVLP